MCVFLLLESPESCKGFFIFFNHKQKPLDSALRPTVHRPDLMTWVQTLFMVYWLRMQ